MATVVTVSSAGILITSILSLVIGVAILLAPRILNYLIAVYLIFIGASGLAMLYL